LDGQQNLQKPAYFFSSKFFLLLMQNRHFKLIKTIHATSKIIHEGRI